MTSLLPRIGAAALGLIVPFVVQAFIVVANVALEERIPESLAVLVSYVGRPLSVLLGFIFIVRACGWYSIGIAIVYVPVTFYVLFPFIFVVLGVVFGRWL